MTLDARPTLLLLLAVLALAATAEPVLGQAQAQAQDALETGRSFADQFFISRRTDPGGGKSLELLGSAIIWFLLALSLVSIGLIGNLAMPTRRRMILPPDTLAEARRLLKEGEYRRVMEIAERDATFFGRVLRAALGEANHGFGAVLRALEQTSEELTALRLRRLEYLNVVGQVSPMIGLFGTVYGMILAFQAIVVAGGNADPVLLAGGIGTALTTTFWGLVVAIPALAGYGVLRNKVDELTAEATLAVEELVNQFRPRSERGGAKQRPTDGP